MTKEELKEFIKNTLESNKYGWRKICIKYDEQISEGLEHFSDFRERVHHFINDTNSPDFCEICKESPAIFIGPNIGYKRFCSHRCSSKYAASQIKIKVDQKAKVAKMKETNLEKYGVEFNSQLKEVQEKKKRNSLEKYGTSHWMKNKEVSSKVKKTTKERYGVSCLLNTEESKKKSAESRRKYFKSDEFCEKIEWNRKQMFIKYLGADVYEDPEKYLDGFPAETICKKLGISTRHFLWLLKEKNIIYNSNKREHVIAKRNPFAFSKLSDENWLRDQAKVKAFYVIANELGVDSSTVFSFCRKHNISITRKQVTTFHREIISYIEFLGITDIKVNDRAEIAPKELDIFVPEKRLAIECNGVYWHKTDDNENYYHMHKRKLCEDKGIELIQVTDIDWFFNGDLIKSMLKSRLGMAERIYARECHVGKITPKEYKDFCEENHIQGYAPASIRLGLFYGEELVQVMSFSKSRYNKEFEWELIRLCAKQGLNIIGGANKLFKHRPKGSIISYCNRHYFSGKIYSILGMDKIAENNPNYFWTKGAEFSNRQNYQKHKLKGLFDSGKLEYFDPNKSETENMMLNGYSKYFDAGHDVYAYL